MELLVENQGIYVRQLDFKKVIQYKYKCKDI